MWRKFWFFFFLFLIVASLHVGRSQAFSILPTKYLVTLGPGQSQAVYLTVKNEGRVGQDFRIFVGGIKQNEQGGIIFGIGTEEAEQWAKPEKDIISLKSGAEENVKFLVSVPSGAPPLSHFLGLAAEAIPEDSQSGVNQIGGRLFSILSLQVAGRAEEVVKIEDFKCDDIFTWDNDWKINLEVSNKGNIDIPLGSRLSVSYLNKEIFEETWLAGGQLLVGAHRRLEKNIRPDILWPGRYQARAQVVYGRTQQTITVLAPVWYFPKWSIAILGILLCVGLSLVYRLYRRHYDYRG